MHNNPTFKYAIPTSVFLRKGGNLDSKKILLSEDVRSKEYKVFNKIGKILYIGEFDVYQEKTNIDLCWVLCDVML
jgi:hypothetical protein